MGIQNRGAAPFGDDVWKRIEDVSVQAARDLLTARRFLEVDGPYGVGLTSIEAGDDGFCREASKEKAGAVVSRALSVPMLHKSFRLSVRRIAAARDSGQPLDLSAVVEAAEAVAALEEELIYFGAVDFGLQGLLTIDGRSRAPAGDWSDLDRALADVLEAVNALDANGYRGPYALALSPGLYNGLFRRYAGTDMLQLEHLNRLCRRGVYKAPIEGGVLVDPRLGVLIVGQDLIAGYEREDGIHVHLFLSESVALRIDEPKAICTIGK